MLSENENNKLIQEYNVKISKTQTGIKGEYNFHFFNDGNGFYHGPRIKVISGNNGINFSVFVTPSSPHSFDEYMDSSNKLSEGDIFNWELYKLAVSMAIIGRQEILDLCLFESTGYNPNRLPISVLRFSVRDMALNVSKLYRRNRIAWQTAYKDAYDNQTG